MVGVSKRYPNGRQALSDISLEVRRGEIVAVIGPSGAGKSTLMRVVNKLVEVSGGSVLIEGVDITRQHGRRLRQVRRKIGMIFQNYNLVYRLSVLENVLHGRLGYLTGVRGVLGLCSEADKAKAVQTLANIGLADFLYSRAGELSGGQKQRVGIARALMQEPLLFLCDEPISSLDPSSSKVVMDTIRMLSRQNDIACVVNLHQVDVALRYATRIVGLSEGRIVFDGPPEQLSHETIEQIYQAPYESLMMRKEEQIGG